MWTIFRFGLCGGDERAYRDAYALLERAGFVRARAGAGGSGAQFPAAVAADVAQDPAKVTREIFETLGAARLRPVGVSGSRARGRGRRLL